MVVASGLYLVEFGIDRVYGGGMKGSGAKASDTKAATARLFRNGRSQAVRLPKEFRFEGDAVRIRRVKSGVLLEPISEGKKFDVDRWFEEIDKIVGESGEFMPQGREQPAMPVREFDL